MKEGWIYKKLGEVFPIIMGKTPPRNIAKYWDVKKETRNLWVSIADLSKNEGGEIHETKEHISDEGKENIKLIPKGSLLVSFKLTLGKMAFAGEDLYTNEAIISLPKRDDVDLMYLYYYFSFLDWNRIASGNEKVKGKTLNKSSLSEIPIAYIPLSEQRAIVARLDSAFAQIDALKANATRQLSEARKLFQKALEEAMTPKEGWEEKTIGAVIDHLRTGLNPRTYFKLNTPDSECYYITVRELKGFTIEPDEKTDKVNRAAIKRINERSNLKIGDVLFSGTGTIGKTALVSELPENWNIKEGVYAMTPKHSKLDSKYFIYYIGSEFFLRLVNDKAAGTGVRSIPMKELVKLPIHVPPLPTQQAIVTRLDSLSANIRALEEVLQKIIAECDALKQAMLRQVFE